jgi:hypothetical protein
MAYAITITKVQGLHETLKQFVKEINEFAWDMRQSGLGVLMPEEMEIKVTLMDEDAGTFQEVETLAGEGKTTTANTTEQKGLRTEAVDITETDVAKVSTQTENSPVMVETAVDTSLSDTTTTNHGVETQNDVMNDMREEINFGTETTDDNLNNYREDVTPGTETQTTTPSISQSTSGTSGSDGTITQYSYA